MNCGGFEKCVFWVRIGGSLGGSFRGSVGGGFVGFYYGLKEELWVGWRKRW